MSEKIREQFEARFPVPDGVAWSDESQHYGWSKGTKQAIQAAMTYRALWTGWQESRAAPVVELPARVDAKPYACYENGWNDMHDEAREAIEAAGLKVTP
ncbi:hypothetical protein [Pseudomonas sp. ZS001]|uniref:hypothetical protein n=1 Tax=Pseudomonas sp. ZS001 TaxID=3138070 RepID=UPI003138B0DB